MSFMLLDQDSHNPTSRICRYCGQECWHQQYRPGEGWSHSHPKCRPQEVAIERRYTRNGNNPMGYIPRSSSPFPPAREDIQKGERTVDSRIERAIRMQHGRLV
jgi:hypothetical protein